MGLVFFLAELGSSSRISLFEKAGSVERHLDEL
jgi:hypothetical protein